MLIRLMDPLTLLLLPAAFWLGNQRRGNDFYRVARHHLTYLFDSLSYEVAEALTAMCLIAFAKVNLSIM